MDRVQRPWDDGAPSLIGSSILVLTTQRQTQRQIARALHASGTAATFVHSRAELEQAIGARRPDLAILDCDGLAVDDTESLLVTLAETARPVPVILVSTGEDKGGLLELVQRYDVGNLLAKRGALRAAYPQLDERELLVTCEKVLSRDIFGVDKYIGSWGIVLRRDELSRLKDKARFLETFERFVTELDCPPSVIHEIVTVADELIINAAVHAPRGTDGAPKYEKLGAHPDLVLEPGEEVSITFGCDGQYLMLSVSDNFGRLDRTTLHAYLSRAFQAQPLDLETKTSGAGLGLSFAARSIHHLVFNIQDGVRTEAIAGWYLRVPNAREFGQVGKSLNVFWLPASG